MKIHKLANSYSPYDGMTPEQRSFPKEVQREAYNMIPETCERVREILDRAGEALMIDLEIDRADYAIVDSALSIAFGNIRDEITHEFRTELMRTIQLNHIYKERLQAYEANENKTPLS